MLSRATRDICDVREFRKLTISSKLLQNNTLERKKFQNSLAMNYVPSYND